MSRELVDMVTTTILQTAVLVLYASCFLYDLCNLYLFPVIVYFST